MSEGAGGVDWLLLNALADRELDAAASLALEMRLGKEPALAAAHARIVAAKDAIERLEQPPVSADFYAHMAALAAPSVVPLPGRPRGGRLWLGDLRAIAASLVVTAFLASGITYMLTAPRPEAGIEDEVIGGHQRSLLASTAVDVASSDRHTVRPWFDAKLGASPPTVDLTSAGFTLVGGRVDVVKGRTVPTLVYRHKQHLISVVAIPEAIGQMAEKAPRFSKAAAFNMARWSRDGFNYWAVSDLDLAQLKVFADNLNKM